MALKNPWLQSITTNVEAKLLCEFYETRYLLFSHNKEDLIEAKKQNARALGLIKDVSNYQMQVFETLGLIQTSFKINSELQLAIDDVYNYKSFSVKTFPRDLKNQNELDVLFKQQSQRLAELIKTKDRKNLNKLISILKLRITID